MAVFLTENAPLRTDHSSRKRAQIDHHEVISVLEKLYINMVACDLGLHAFKGL